MPLIEVMLDSDLTFEGNSISIKRDSNSNNAFELKDDGIYVGNDSTGEKEGFPDGDYGMFMIGMESGYDRRNSYTLPGRVSTNVCVHRTFTAIENENNQIVVENIRERVDCFKPGDFLRVARSNDQYEYFIITETTEGAGDAKNGNDIKAKVSLGTW